MKGIRKACFCVDSRECFAKRNVIGKATCYLLDTGYSKDGDCPFAKPKRDYTNGVHYPVTSGHK